MFSLETLRISESFEGLNSSLAQLAVDLFLHKDPCKLLDLTLTA